MRILIKHKRFIRITTMLILFSAVLFYALIYINEGPGGLSDRRMSHVMGLSATIHIPLGKTPEDAIEQFRRPSSMQVVHREPVEGGTLLFMKRHSQENSSNLQVEYARKTWIGWKWVWGGGFGTSESPQSALNYMSMSTLDNISTPFPMVFGDIQDSSITNITVKTEGEGKYNAKLITGKTGEMIWFVSLPSSVTTPFDIECFNEEGDLIAYKTINDPNDMGSVNFRK